jgi:methylenetetrahydrofolate dehydrogenase (NADP+)/methenyltetrahydrofolate cyclohydrolase
MSAKIIDGKKISGWIKKMIAKEVDELKQKGIEPTLAIISVGEDYASKIYIRNKQLACKEVGINIVINNFPEKAKEEDLLKLISNLNKDPRIHAVLVQLPLPKHLDDSKIIEAINPEKDVDGLHPKNFGRLLEGDESIVPCTPKGIIRILEHERINLEGKDVVIINHSKLVGKPLALLMLNRDATVTICHAKTKNLIQHTRQADILISAVGKPCFIKKNMVKKGSVVIDVGISHKGKLCGDVDFDSVKEVASYITPVPGGIGPMTVAIALENTVLLAKLLQKVD